MLIEEIKGLPDEDSEDFKELVKIVSELDNIIKEETPFIVYETFFLKLLAEEEVSLNIMIKSLVMLIMWQKTQIRKLGKDAPEKERVVH